MPLVNQRHFKTPSITTRQLTTGGMGVSRSHVHMGALAPELLQLANSRHLMLSVIKAQPDIPKVRANETGQRDIKSVVGVQLNWALPARL